MYCLGTLLPYLLHIPYNLVQYIHYGYLFITTPYSLLLQYHTYISPYIPHTMVDYKHYTLGTYILPLLRSCLFYLTKRIPIYYLLLPHIFIIAFLIPIIEHLLHFGFATIVYYYPCPFVIYLPRLFYYPSTITTLPTDKSWDRFRTYMLLLPHHTTFTTTCHSVYLPMHFIPTGLRCIWLVVIITTGPGPYTTHPAFIAISFVLRGVDTLLRFNVSFCCLLLHCLVLLSGTHLVYFQTYSRYSYQFFYFGL